MVFSFSMSTVLAYCMSRTVMGQSRKKPSAILMMADSVEAASRSLPDYTEKSIRDLVNRLIDGQVSEGYFRECPITFRDIEYAKTVLIEKLKTIYHTRVSYPELKK